MFIHIWKVVVIMVAFIFLTAKETLYIMFSIIILAILTPFVSDHFGLAITKISNEALWYTNQRLTIILFILLISCIIYYGMMIQKTKTKIEMYSILNNNESETGDSRSIVEKMIEDFDEVPELNGKTREIYQKIKIYFEKEKPYLNQKFNMDQLAKDIDSNLNYVSRTLNIIDEKGFVGFVNRYRISYVLEQLQYQKHKNFTLSYIYESAGFSQQSTFNRVFKYYLGQSPREYIKNIKNTSQDENPAGK